MSGLSHDVEALSTDFLGSSSQIHQRPHVLRKITLAVLQHCLDVFNRPSLARRQHAHAAVVASTDECVRADFVSDVNELQISIRFPIERDVDVARKNPPG